MACTHCPQHCPRPVVSEALVLDGPPSSDSTPNVNARWYRTFAVAYEAARAARLRPRQALMAANPWMSASQCSTYLKRARSYGFVSVPARPDARPAVAPVPRVPVEEERPERVVATSRRGRKRGGLQVLTADQCNMVLNSGEPAMETLTANCDRGVPITADKLCRAHTAKLTEREATAVLQWAVDVGDYRWAMPGESILPVDG